MPKKTIYEDFMKTNMYLDKEMEYMIRFLETKMIVDNQVMDKIRLFYRVKEEYLDIVFETIKKDFGSMDMFMKKALYMNPKNIEALTKKISCIKMHKMSKNAMYIKFFVDKRFNVAIIKNMQTILQWNCLQV